MPQNRLQEAIARNMRRHVFTQPSAKAYVLCAYAMAEGSGEGAIFDRALERAVDPKVAKLIRKHKEDELRHERMIIERRLALGLPWMPVPEALRGIDVLSDAAGGVLDLPMDKDEDLRRVYELLYVIEERAYQEFDDAASALELSGDHETAAVFREIRDDEANHLRYCIAVGNMFSESEAAFMEGVQRMRVLEAKVYAEQGRQTMRHLLDARLIDLPLHWEVLVRGMSAIADALHLSGPETVQPAFMAA